MNKRLKYGLLSLGVIILAGFLLKGNITHQRFDSEKWKNWTKSESEWSLRWDMMNSLRKNYELKGMTKNEIIKLLGEPASQTPEEFGYDLGYSKRGINTGTLTIRFGKDSKVTGYSVWDG